MAPTGQLSAEYYPIESLMKFGKADQTGSPYGVMRSQMQRDDDNIRFLLENKLEGQKPVLQEISQINPFVKKLSGINGKTWS